MHLAVNPPVLPMLAKPAHALPDGERWLFEPKWDGFRALVFRDADELFIQSRDEKPLGRYYPELIEPLRVQLPQRCVLDGEIVIVRSGGLDFEALQLRLHPAESRVRLLAKEMPASVVFFDILCECDRDLRSVPFEERRAALARLLARAQPPLHLTPSTRDRTVAADWFRRFELPIPCSNRFGTPAGSIICRSPSPRHWVSKVAARPRNSRCSSRAPG